MIAKVESINWLSNKFEIARNGSHERGEIRIDRTRRMRSFAGDIGKVVLAFRGNLFISVKKLELSIGQWRLE